MASGMSVVDRGRGARQVNATVAHANSEQQLCLGHRESRLRQRQTRLCAFEQVHSTRD